MIWKKAGYNYKRPWQKGLTKSFECKLIAKDSQSFCAELSVSIVPDPQGKPGGFVSVLSDVTDRRKAEYLVRKSEEKHRSLVEGISHIIFTTDTTGRFTYVSPVIQAGFGIYSARTDWQTFLLPGPFRAAPYPGRKIKRSTSRKTGPIRFSDAGQIR